MFRYGRDALWSGLLLLGLEAHHEVLMPASNCEVVMLPFVKRGLSIRYYGLNGQFEFDLGEIESRIGPQTRAVYANHYLGRPTDLSGLRRLCTDRGLFLIEDCAHALGGADQDGPVGQKGDIAIFSYRKFLPFPDGGGLRINIPHSGEVPESGAASRLVTAGGVFKSLTLALAARGLLPLAAWKRWRADMDAYLTCADEIDAADWVAPRQISPYSKKRIAGTELEPIINLRRENYRFWQQNLTSLRGVMPLFTDLAEGQNPFCFPILSENRDQLVQAMAKRGIYLEPTIGPPYRNIPKLGNPDEPFPVLEDIAARMLSLPVHQSLVRGQLEFIFQALQETCREWKPS